ncbi:hypothetical protein FHS95_001966 [Sphingomonas naasensis]|uniref:hypothetical protein n=1 Tax=Sphingomonas naasensis TaxID=1344951 RepID=UPI00141AAB5A|nr:hypothetical protein [Sphingomonas naasensis]NIJ20274.1 hypothetical protein [Sphingomonas naasensis]
MIIAYALMLIMTLLAAGGVSYAIYHSHARTYRRRLRKERSVYDGSQSPRP